MKTLLILFFAFLIIFPQTAYSQELSGYLGDSNDAFQVSGDQQSTYPKYWEWGKFKLNPKKKYTCRAWAKTFLPKIWIDDRDATGHSQSMPRSEGNDVSPSGYHYAEVTFQPLYNTDTTIIAITSQGDSRRGKSPKGKYKIECESVPVIPRKQSPVIIRFPPPNKQIIPPVVAPVIPTCPKPSWILNKTTPPLPDLWLSEPPYGGGSEWSWDGDKIWAHNGKGYLKQKAGGFERYDDCGKLMSRHKREYTNTLHDGRSREGGSTTYPGNKDRKDSWYVDWRNN